MSLKSLCNVSLASIERVDSTINAAMGQVRTYSTATRTTAGLPTSSRGRLQQLTENRRMRFGVNDVEIDAVWYTITDPQVDDRDKLIVGGKNYYVHGMIDFDLQGRLYRVGLQLFVRGIR